MNIHANKMTSKGKINNKKTIFNKTFTKTITTIGLKSFVRSRGGGLAAGRDV